MSALALWWSGFFIALVGGAVAVWALIIRGRLKGHRRRPDRTGPVAQGELAEHDALLLAYLGGHDEPCPMCEYNLRGLTGTVCPECGEALRLRVSLSEPKMAAYLCGLIGLSVGVGFSGIILAFGIVGTMMYGFGGGPPYWMIVALVSQFVIEGLAIWAWLVRRNWIRRRDRNHRWALAAAACGCTFGFTVLWFTMIFL